MFDRALARPLWWDDVVFPTRPTLQDDREVDVAIVGGGYTGLWTAFELSKRDPSLSILVLERDHIGFGASGRNGGWCYDGFAAGMETIERMSSPETARDFGAALREMVGEVAKVVADEAIDCDFNLGGSIEFLRNGGQVARAEGAVAIARRFGWTEEDLRVISAAEATSIARASGVRAGLWSKHTATLDPARLALGLAESVEKRGVEILESTPVTRIEPGRVVTSGGGTVRASVIVRATEGYTADLEGEHRTLSPLYSLMIATEPLPDARWEEIGLAGRPAFGDLRHLVIYGQRTADGRIAFGGRGAPYDYGSRIRTDHAFPVEAFEPVREALVDLFPSLHDVTVTHRWGGVLGVSRKWMPTVGFDPRTGLAWAGGYVGSGVTAANLAGRTLAELMTGGSGRLTRLPWVNLSVRRWEIEPLRWLGINAALQVMSGADTVEGKKDRPARRADLLWKAIK